MLRLGYLGLGVMSDGVQPGTKVDEELWERFREEVKRRKGGVRGHLRTELENALRSYIHGGEATPADIDARLQRIEAAVGAAGTDGGTDTPETNADTHTRQLVTEKPAANAATEKKVAYLANQMVEEYNLELDGEVSLPRRAFINVVKEEYGFRKDTAKRYVESVADELGLVDHPDSSFDNFVTEPKREQILDEQREQVKEEADEKMENL